jgi:hypothetical protein
VYIDIVFLIFIEATLPSDSDSAFYVVSSSNFMRVAVMEVNLPGVNHDQAQLIISSSYYFVLCLLPSTNPNHNGVCDKEQLPKLLVGIVSLLCAPPWLRYSSFVAARFCSAFWQKGIF